MSTRTHTRRARTCSSIVAAALLLTMTSTGIALADDTVVTEDQPAATTTEATTDPLNQEAQTSETEATPATTESSESTATPEVEAAEEATEEPVTTQETEQTSTPAPVTATEPSETPTTTEQPAPDTTTSVAPEAPECVEVNTEDWTDSDYNKEARSGVLVAKAEGFAEGTPLCDPVAVKGALYTYPEVPTLWTMDDGNPVPWHQTLNQDSETTLVVDKLGSYPFSLPPAACTQADFYAARFSQGGLDALVLAPVLFAPGQPYEPRHIHELLESAGLPSTYTSSIAEGCDTPPVDEPETRVVKTETPQPHEQFVCGDEVATIENYTLIRTYLETLENGVVVGSDLIDEKLVQDETTYRELTPAEIESCKPETPAPDVVTGEWQDQQWACNATQTWQTRQVSTTPYNVVYTSGSTYNVVAGTPVVKTERQLRDLEASERTVCPVQTFAYSGPTLAATGSNDTQTSLLLSSAGSLLLLGACIVGLVRRPKNRRLAA